MLYERRFEQKTKGIICGPALIQSSTPEVGRLTRLKKPNRFELGALIAQPRAQNTVHCKIVIRARDGGEVVWMRPFACKDEAMIVWLQMIGLSLDRMPDAMWCPSYFVEGDLEYIFATVATFNTSTNNSALNWTAGGSLSQPNITLVDYLIIGSGGGGGGRPNGGGTGTGAAGGGAGGFQYQTSQAITPSTNYPIVIGAAGVGAVSGVAATAGSNVSITGLGAASVGGGRGGNWDVTTSYNDPSTGGSGGGGEGLQAAGAAGTAGQGNTGGSGLGGTGPTFPGGGGGGASAVGTDASGATPGNGGDGTANSISGSSVTYSGGGRGNSFSGSAGTNGAGQINAGGGGAAGGEGANGANAVKGVVILSFTSGWEPYYAPLQLKPMQAH